MVEKSYTLSVSCKYCVWTLR